MTGKTLLHVIRFAAPFAVSNETGSSVFFSSVSYGVAPNISLFFSLNEKSFEEVKTTFTKRHKMSN